MNQPSLFDPPPKRTVAESARDAGIAASEKTCGDEWREYAIEFLKSFLRTHATMHVDQLWEAGLRRPKSPRGLGAVIQFAATEGWMEKQESHGCVLARPSTNSNMQLKPVWRSNLYCRHTASEELRG